VPGKYDRLRPRLLWKILRKIVAGLRPLRGRQRHHRADQLVPTLFCEAAGVGDEAERVAFRALRLDGLLAGTVGQRQCRTATGALAVDLARDADARQAEDGDSDGGPAWGAHASH